ncbi:MAG: TIGR03936 family radical SAM-associated protein [Oscillospiraceae bacterium]|nr:TIGR03936 family radical SAM-associated protein [Oscillospiraceae bacterium]
MQNTRIWFSKRGRAKYISHLDLMRAMSRTVRRAGLPIWYTEGFNPHPYLSFALPLPLGQEGLREAMDIRLLEDMPLDEIARRFDGVLPEGIEILGASQPWCGPGEIAAAEYEITIPCEDAEGFCARAERLLADKALTATKMGKQGHRKIEKEIALAPLILSYGLRAGEGEARLACTLAAGSEHNLNPALLCEALGAQTPQITRVRLLRGDGSDWE